MQGGLFRNPPPAQIGASIRCPLVRRKGGRLIAADGEMQMKFMTMVKTTRQAGAPPVALMQAIGQLGQDATAAGVLVTQGGLLGKDRSAFVTVRKGAVMIVDGPFAEAKELIGGYAVYELPDMAAAMVWAERFARIHAEHWPEWEGEIEVRPIM